jgi:cell wall-associated NlpC family hydrolase
MITVTRAAFVALVRSYVGTPFHHQGRLPGVGMDCPAPIVCACWHFGLKPREFDVVGYPRVPDGVTLQRYCDEHMTRIAPALLQPGDAVLVAWAGGPPQHLGVVVDYPGALAMVHADSIRRRAVVETRLVFGRAMRLVSGYAIPGVA